MRDERKEGHIDGSIISYFESLSTEEAIRVMASVEKRTLENAESSTRALLQLSKDIKSMRGSKGPNGFKKSMYNGRVIFDDMLVKQFEEINMDATNYNVDVNALGTKLHSFIGSILSQKNVWEPLLVGDKVVMNGEERSGQDLMDGLEALDKKLQDAMLTANTSEDRKMIKLYVDTALTIVDACNRLDTKVSNKRREVFESYVGEDFAASFLPYFNNTFGTEDDVEITIEMLEDDTLIAPFLQRRRALMASMNVEQMVESMIKLLEEFWNVHSNRLPAKNYGELISGISNILPSSDSMSELLARSGKSVDGIFTMAEGLGDAWIMSILRYYPGMFTEEDISNMRDALSGTNKPDNTSRKTRIL